MTQLLSFLQDAVAVAFVALGIVTAVSWVRRRDRSLGFLAAAIILLAFVSGAGRLQGHLPFTIPVLAGLELVAFAGCGYALLRYRDSLIPLPSRWHAAAAASLTAASALILAATSLPIPRAALVTIALAWLGIWALCVCEPIFRFWRMSSHLPAVQAWRLRSLSLGFGGLILVLLVAIAAGSLVRQPVVQVVIEFMTLAIVPLLYASFSPPAWLRRQWRAEEEEHLRAFMEQLLLNEERDAMASRAMELSLRLVGGAAGALFDASGIAIASRGLDSAEVEELASMLSTLPQGAGRPMVNGQTRAALVVPVKGFGSASTVVVLAGPFTPGFGADETTRMQQLMSAFVTALDRRHAIVELERTNVALQEANKHKSVFLANMSHELRTPLNAIIGFSELLTDARDGQFDDATRKRFLSQILTSGRHLLGLINDILDLSKVEAGQMELRLQAVAIAESVDQVVRTVEPLVTKKGIRLEADVDGAGEMLADAGKLKQMLLNLVSNAIKFTPEGGSITITARRRAASVDISVADTGIGIADADQKQIFQEFHQVDQGPGRKHEGTGLGLALTKRFAVLHGGDVRVTSAPGKGSVFTLTLPLRPTAATGPAPGPVPAPASAMNGHGHGPLILVVEDDPGAAELLTRQLVSAGYRAEVARTGTAALEKARRLQPAAITLDIILPEVDGWEVITRLKSDPATSEIPIVVVSVVDNPELGMALGAMDYFVKPVDGKELVNRLNHFQVQKDEIRVLVVDDQEANRNWLTKTLEPAGFTVIPASGGREAIDLARREKPDFVLLDLMMPEVTGFDVVEALRADESTRDVPIMVLTATNLTEADKRLLNGRVTKILSRGSVGTSDIVGLLKRVVAHRNGAT
jgi:signal transduction histidine kinase/DNA-binding response OmpR family regulator